MKPNHDLIQKMLSEAKLSQEEELQLEAMLAESDASSRDLLSAMPTDVPSMAWRSELNERLQSLAPAPKASKGWLKWAPLAGLSATAAFAVTLMVTRQEPVRQDMVSQSPPVSLESKLLTAHRDVVTAMDVSAHVPEAQAHGIPVSASDWSESDLESL